MADTLICTLDMTKTAGLTVTVKNDAGEVTQTITMDGTTTTVTVKGRDSTSTVTQDAKRIVHTVAGDQQTSTITQVQDKVTINAKAVEIDAETVTVKTTKDTNHHADGKFTMSSTDDMHVSTSAQLQVESTAAMKIATKDELNVQSTKDTKHSAMNTKSESQMKAEISAVQIGIKGSGKAELVAPMTTVGQDLTTIKGSLVDVDAQLIKLG